MNMSFLASSLQPPPLASFAPWRKDKVVVVVGATGTGKSRLSIDLATRFPSEIVNSDKMQVYKGLDILTNKITEEEHRHVPHHLLGIIDPNADFTALDFQRHASLAVDSIAGRYRLPIIAGGSNSFVKALVNDSVEFRSRYECCILWVDVLLPVLHSFVSERVDRMVEMGLVEEVRAIFDPTGVYSRGIRRATGVQEIEQFLLAEQNVDDDETKALLLQEAIEKIKSNTCKLARYQLQNILRLRNQLGWKMHRLDATRAFLNRGGGGGGGTSAAPDAWEELVAGQAAGIVEQFLCCKNFVPAIATPTAATLVRAAPIPATPTATVTAAAH